MNTEFPESKISLAYANVVFGSKMYYSYVAALAAKKSLFHTFS